MDDNILSQQSVQTCLKEKEIEIFILRNDLFLRNRKPRYFTHIKSCNKCWKKYLELRIFYEILNLEFKKPISSKIRKFTKELQKSLS